MRVLLGLMIVALMWSCSDKEDIIKPDPAIVENVKALADQNQVLGWSLFNELSAEDADENIIISPWSIQVALSMALGGSDGSTRDEMLEILGCSGCDETSVHEKMSELSKLLTTQNGRATLTSANGLFHDPNRIDVYRDFIDLIKAYYNAREVEHNFADPATVDKINDWVKSRTNGKIEAILEEISNDDVAFLINSLHFKADWANPFPAETTREGEFTRADRQVITAKFMDLDQSFHAVTDDDFKMVDIPFRDSIFSMTLLAPRSPFADNVADWRHTFSPTRLNALYNDMHYGRILLQVPKMDLDYKEDMVEVLRKIGMTKPFSEFEADFSRLGQPLIGANLYISKVLHKAVLKVDEKGAEGAAVTSIGISVTSLPPTYRFDHPYIAVIRHIPTGAILFMAYVNDPNYKD